MADELVRFEQVLQRVVRRLDERIPPDTEPDADQLAAIVGVCAWSHAEWVRIHPFAIGNGRTARLWVNSLASRSGCRPFLHLGEMGHPLRHRLRFAHVVKNDHHAGDMTASRVPLHAPRIVRADITIHRSVSHSGIPRLMVRENLVPHRLDERRVYVHG